MNKKKYILIFLILVLGFSYLNSIAQWQNDIRLTINSASSLTSFNNTWCIASNGDTVHVVWSDERDGNSEIYYKRSIDRGVNWGNDLRLTNNSGSSQHPSVTIAGSNIFIVWEDNRNLTGYNTNIFYKSSTDGGVNWGADIQLTNKSSRSNFPSLCVSGQLLNVTWEDNRDGNFEIYYKRSTDYGLNWETDKRLTNDTANSFLTSISVSGQVLHMVWTDERDGNKEIYYKTSSNGGVNWGTDVRLTNASGDSWFPSIAVFGQDVYAVWREGRDSNSEIYFKRSTNGGMNWESDARLTSDAGESFFPSISVSGQNVHIVWRDSRDGNGEIYYKRSTDGGINWSSDLRLTNATGDSRFPSVSVSGQKINVIWSDKRDGNDEIYFKCNPTGSIGIKKVNEYIPDKYYLFQNYPNPFNPSTIIRFQIRDSRFVSLKVYDILGREVATLINEKLKAGIYEVPISISQISNNQKPSGVYFCILSIDNIQISTIKMILSK